MQTARRLVKGPDTAETSEKNLASENRTWILEFTCYTLAINKNKKHNQLYLDEESQSIFRYHA